MGRKPAAVRSPAVDGAPDAPGFVLEDFLPHRLAVVSARAHRLFARACAERAGLAVSEWQVLSVLARSGDLSATDVARQAAMDKVKVSRAVRSLLERRLLRRAEDRRDRRVRRLAITALGRRTQTGMVPLVHALESEMLGPLSAEERDRLRAALSRLDRHLAAIGADTAEMPDPD
ncbi:MAG: winged helix-turn-helix transcriptional regulator [Acetobacteraceae bacterium]|nr:winged helix-turn-helix transcriptional regulator [Acetobacteraceae bacterium]